jgi:hypothetical protein
MNEFAENNKQPAKIQQKKKNYRRYFSIFYSIFLTNDPLDGRIEEKKIWTIVIILSHSLQKKK